MSEIVKKIHVDGKNLDIDAKYWDGHTFDEVITEQLVFNCNGGTKYETIKPNKYYKFYNVSSLSIQFDTPNTGILNNYMFEVTFAGSGSTLSIRAYNGDELRWANNTTPSVCEPGGTYQISIINNLGVLQKF